MIGISGRVVVSTRDQTGRQAAGEQEKEAGARRQERRRRGTVQSERVVTRAPVLSCQVVDDEARPPPSPIDRRERETSILRQTS